MQSVQGQSQTVAAPPQQQPPVLWGLAADLAQAGGMGPPQPQESQAGGWQQHGPQPRSRSASGAPPSHADRNAQQQRPPAAFGLHSSTNQLQADRRPYFAGSGAPGGLIAKNPGPTPYGLALELTQGGMLNPLQVQPGSSAPPTRSGSNRVAKRALSQQLTEAGWVAAAAVPPGLLQDNPSFQPVRPEEEPDYGIVAELKQAGQPDPLGARDFGLAAEVVRRRGGPLPPLGGRYGSTGGSSLPPLRPRKRLAAAGPPADFGMSEEIAERQAQVERDRLDPFNAANRASGQDPFVMAGELVKFPTVPSLPQAPQEQELVKGPIPLKVPNEGEEANTSAVVGDGSTYGIATELGAEEAWQRQQAELAAVAALPVGVAVESGEQPPGPTLEEQQRQQLLELLEWEPTGHKYVYNEETGMLQTTEGGQGAGGRVAREFIEDGATGAFYNLNDPGLWRRITRFFERKPGPDDYDDGPEKGFRAGLKTTASFVSNFFSMLGIFVQALLGGFSCLNLFLTYFMYSSQPLNQFLQIYSPVSMQFSRAYFTLLTLSVIASTARLCHDQLRGFQPRRLRLMWVDGFQVLAYSVAYIASVLCTPLDDELTYEYDRNSLYYLLTFNSSFNKRLSFWNMLNLIRIIASGLGLLLLCYQHSPYVFEHTVKYETHQKLKAILMPKAMLDPTMVMWPLEPPVRKRSMTSHQQPEGSRRDGSKAHGIGE